MTFTPFIQVFNTTMPFDLQGYVFQFAGFDLKPDCIALDIHMLWRTCIDNEFKGTWDNLTYISELNLSFAAISVSLFNDSVNTDGAFKFGSGGLISSLIDYNFEINSTTVMSIVKAEIFTFYNSWTPFLYLTISLNGEIFRIGGYFQYGAL
jgi:hypothetical protein